MSWSNALENAWLLLLLQNTNIANVGDATGLRGSTTAGSLYVSLHSADPGEAGDQTTNEITYTGYARVAVARTSGGWTVASNAFENAALVQFGKRTDVGSVTVRWAGLGTASSGAGVLLARMPLAGAAFNFTGKASDDTLTIPATHGLVVNDTVVCQTTPGDVDALPTGITMATVYYVKTVSGSAVTLSATLGGGTLDLTADGSGQIQKLSEVIVTQNIRPEFAAGDLDFSMG